MVFRPLKIEINLNCKEKTSSCLTVNRILSFYHQDKSVNVCRDLFEFFFSLENKQMTYLLWTKFSVVCLIVV
jgi:hypothetical protein